MVCVWRVWFMLVIFHLSWLRGRLVHFILLSCLHIVFSSAVILHIWYFELVWTYGCVDHWHEHPSYSYPSIHVIGLVVMLYVDTSILYIHLLHEEFLVRALCLPLSWHTRSWADLCNFRRGEDKRGMPKYCSKTISVGVTEWLMYHCLFPLGDGREVGLLLCSILSVHLMCMPRSINSWNVVDVCAYIYMY